MREQYWVQFPNTKYDELKVQPSDRLIDKLTSLNSPILFGCRTGICGTCLVKACGDGALTTLQKDEEDILNVFEVDPKEYRLACQLKGTCNMSLEVK